MSSIDFIESNRAKLKKEYKELIELAYNTQQTDCAFSDITEFKAIELLDKINRLKFLSKEQLTPA
jgi:hypothetical protein